MSVAVVVIGRDEGAHLVPALRAAARALARVGGGDLLYVDSGSRDGSADRVRAATDARVIELEGPPYSAARARNAGIAACRAELVQLVDGDMELDVDWLERASALLEDRPEVAAVDGLLRERSLGGAPFNAAFGLDWPRTGGEVDRLGGAALWRREALIQLDGFDESMAVGEDPDLALRARAAGAGLARIAAPMATHDLGLVTARDWWRRALAVGRSRALVARRHPAHRSEALRPSLEATLALALVAAGVFHSPAWLALLGAAVAIRGARSYVRDRRDGFARTHAIVHSVHVQAVKVPVAMGVLSSLR